MMMDVWFLDGPWNGTWHKVDVHNHYIVVPLPVRPTVTNDFYDVFLKANYELRQVSEMRWIADFVDYEVQVWVP